MSVAVSDHGTTGVQRVAPTGLPPPAAAAPAPSALEDALADLDPDALTPREALAALYRLKALARPQA